MLQGFEDPDPVSGSSSLYSMEEKLIKKKSKPNPALFVSTSALLKRER